MNWQLWLRGLFAAFLGGLGTAISVTVVDPTDFNFEAGIWKVAKVALVSAGISMGAYLKEHPDPWRDR